MRIGPYEITGELGRGGMGVVYRARHVEMGREVAIKLMLDPSPSAEVTERFIREVRFTAQAAGHPGIAKIHHAGSTPDGRLFCAMEMIPGKSLQAILADEGSLAPVRAARYVALAAEAMHHAHAQGVLHRDLSPKNIMVDPQDLPRILDFGLARSVSNATKLTVTGAILGTPVYMAPEQVDGGDRVTPLTDVYALGACLYACLTGRAPYPDGPLYGVIAKVLEEDPPPIESVRSDVPEALRNIAYKAMAKDPADRYASAQDLAKDLRAFARGESVTAGPRVRRRPGKARLVAAAAALIVLVAAASYVATGPGGPGPSTPAPSVPPSILAPTEARGDPAARLATSLAEEAMDVLGELRSLAFRALLPRPGDPSNPFTRWEEFERAGFRRLWDASAPPPLAAQLPDLPALRRQQDENPEAAWPTWAAAMAACGQDEMVLRDPDRPATGAARLVTARLLLVRGEPTEAIAALGDLPGTASPEAQEALYLRALARLMDADLPRARVELALLRDTPLRLDASTLEALVARVSPPEDLRDLMAMDRLLLTDDPGYGGGEESLRAEALGILDRDRDANEPVDRAVLHARILLDDDRYEEALLRLESARGVNPGNAQLLDAYLWALDLVLHGASHAGRRTSPPDLFGGDRLAMLAEVAGAARRRLDSVGDDGPMCSSRLALRARESDHQDLCEQVQGMDALGFGLAGRLLDGAIRILVARGNTPLTPDERTRAFWLARMAHTLAPGCQAACLLAGLRTEVRIPSLGATPLGWFDPGVDPRLAVDSLETASLRARLPVPLLMALAVTMLGEAEGGRRDDWHRLQMLDRTWLVLDAAQRAVGGDPSPELRLLCARCARALEVAGAENPPEAGALVERALDESVAAPLLLRGTRSFLDDATGLCSDLGVTTADSRLLASLTAHTESASEDHLRTLFHLAADAPNGQRNGRDIVRAADFLLPLAPSHPADVPRLWTTAWSYGENGDDPVRGLVLWGRLLRLGEWQLMFHALPACGITPFGTAVATVRQRSLATDNLDALIGMTVAQICDPEASTERLVRGIGAATSLLAFRVAPGPLLAARAYARLRLGDARGALLDARAAARARISDVHGDATSRMQEEFARYPRFVELLSLALLGADESALKDIFPAIGFDPSTEQPVNAGEHWIFDQLGPEYATAADRRLVQFAADHRVLDALVHPEARRSR